MSLATRFAPATTRGYYAVLRLILNAAVNADLIGRSPCRGIRLPPSAPTTRRLPDPSEVHRLAEAIELERRANEMAADHGPAASVATDAAATEITPA